VKEVGIARLGHSIGQVLRRCRDDKHHTDVSRQEALITLREGMTSTLRSANFPNRLCHADDLVNWCARFTNPHRLMVDRIARAESSVAPLEEFLPIEKRLSMS